MLKSIGPSNLSTSLFAPDTEPHSTETLRPPVQTIVPAKDSAQKSDDGIAELQKAIEAIKVTELAGETEEEPKKWDDSMFERVKRLGEGAGGAVYQVRERSTGRMIAMKV
jgi:mitogen-activated protein kinase kinase